MERLKRRSVRIAALAAISALLVPAGAFGKIAPPNCENGGGQQPGGQQPTCKNDNLTQNPAKNPAGSAPPGQQP